MPTTSPVRVVADGYRSSSASTRATFHDLVSYAVTIAAARAINLRRERRRKVPLVPDEVGILIDQDNSYWGGERLAQIQGAVTGLAALGLGGEFARRGARPWCPRPDVPAGCTSGSSRS